MKAHVLHQPLRGILDRDLALANAQKLIDYWSPYLEELCNYASNVLGRCKKSMEDTPGTPSSIILLFYHVIQMADGIDAVCSQAYFAAAIPTLRRLWEGALSIEYILRDDFESRSTAWMTSHLINTTLAVAGKLRPGERVNLDIREILKRHRPESIRS